MAQLSNIDRENIEVFEALGVDEPTLHFFLSRYFACRAFHPRLTPNEALQQVIRDRMEESEVEEKRKRLAEITRIALESGIYD